MRDGQNWDRVRDEFVPDSIATIRVCQEFGTVAIYIKTGEDRWLTIYVDPDNGDFLMPKSAISEAVAGRHPVVFSPKSVV